MGSELQNKASAKLENPIGLDGLEFIEYVGPDASLFERLFQQLGFVLVAKHTAKPIFIWQQNDIRFLLNTDKGNFADGFQKRHGPCICSTGFRVKDAQEAFRLAVQRGAKPYEGTGKTLPNVPAIYGIGDSLIYFIDQYGTRGDCFKNEFQFSVKERPMGLGFQIIDHLTNNVPRGEMQKWCDFYEKIFNFSERRYFDIKGKATGLISKVMQSPDGKIIIPINEPTDSKSQIQEYLDEYHGSGIQHVALLTTSIIPAIQEVRTSGINFLDTPDSYYKYIPERLPQITESLNTLQELRILVDGDSKGYLLQIFTKNLIGPIFFEVIQRKGHDGFGEGNFQALFDAIERDQRERGYLT